MAANFRNDQLRRQHLAALDLNTGELTEHWPLEAGVNVEEETLSRCGDGRFAFYARNSKPGYKFRQHGIYTIDPNDGQQQYTQLPSKPTPVGISVRRWLFQDKRRGLVLMPAADSLTKVSEDSFAFELQLLDLNTAEVRWTRTVRHLSLSQIRDFRFDELAEALNRIAAGEYLDTDNDEWQTLLTSLTGVWFDPDRDEIWLGWQDWHLQKIGLDGEPLSPLYPLGTEKGDGTLSAPMPNSLERLVPVGREGNALLLDYDYELDQHLTAELPEPAGQATPLAQQEVIWLRGQPNTRPCIEIPTPLQAQPSPGGCVLVTSSDLNSTAGVTQALEQLLNLMPELEKSFAAPQKPSGWLGKLFNKKQKDGSEPKSTLYLLFCDALGQVKREEFFYAAAPGRLFLCRRWRRRCRAFPYQSDPAGDPRRAREYPRVRRIYAGRPLAIP